MEAVGHIGRIAAGFSCEGILHSRSAPAQLVSTALRHFRSQRNLVFLVIDPARVKAPLKFEKGGPSGELLPHIRGPLNLDAVLKVVAMPPSNDGGFSTPDLVL